MTMHYTAYHIPTQTRHFRSCDVENRSHLLSLLDAWNRLGQTVWQYWEGA